MVKDHKMGWKDLPEGDRLEAGTAANFKTGDWRSEKPVWNKDKCIQCMICWIDCPDSAIIIKDGKVAGIDYDHCKGCGICAKECPPKVRAITMEKEKK
ncbi:MAG: 4Fe-4S binding protein [Endomicrobiales bacterium]|nr:4Fe-4S binding protein [Endomicrobiales bacterium]